MDGLGLLRQLLGPEGLGSFSLLPGQGGQDGVPVCAPFGFDQVQQQGGVGRVGPQGGQYGGPYLLLGLGEDFQQPGGDGGALDRKSVV